MTRGRVRLAAFGVALALLAAPVPGEAGDPRLRWRTLETEHFQIHFHENEREVARRLAVVAERAHAELSPAMKWKPKRKTHIVLTDDTDSANGSATVLPYNLIRLYTTAPESASVLNDHDDWLYGLVVHEYAHILHLDNISGLARVVNAVIGKVWAPNQVQPRFIVEGIATYEESKRSSSGRLRSAIFDMYLRTALLEGKLQRLDQITYGAPLQWPQGTTAYLYGSSLLAYVADRYGDAAVARLAQEYGGARIEFWAPFAVNRALRRAVGKDWPTIYQEWATHLRRRYDLQVAEARARGLTASRAVTVKAYGHYYPQFTTDGELLYLRDDGTARPAWMAVRPAGTDPERLRLAHPRRVRWVRSLGKFALHPDGVHVAFDEYSPVETVYGYTDLREYDLPTGEYRDLTHAARAREPAYSPDGTTLAYVQSDLGTSWLMAMPARGGKGSVLYRGARFTQVYTPTWSPDGKEIAFSVWEAGGYRDLVVLEVGSGKLRRLTRDRALDLDPAYTPDGRYLLFSSDRTGIYNVYALERATGTLWQVTNVLGGAFQPQLSRDGRLLAFQSFGADGFDIHLMRFAPGALKLALPYVNTRPDPPVIPDAPKPPPDRPYNALRSVWPRTWSFTYAPDSFGQALTLQTSGADAVGLHGWSVVGTFGFARGTVSANGSYWYSGLWPALGLSVFRTIGRRSGLYVDGQNQNFIETDVGGSAAISLPVHQTADRSVAVSAAYRFEWLTSHDARVPADPNDLMPSRPEEGRLASLSASASYYDAQSWLYSITPERGRYVHVGVSVMHRVLGGQYNVVSADWLWQEYLANPLFRRHVLALRYAGGIGQGDLLRRGIYWLGGYSSQADVLRTYIDPRAARAGGPALRGYAPWSLYGDQFHLLNAEYRFPIAYVDRGFSTLPWWLSRIHGAVFADCGNAFFGDFDFAKLKVGVGGQVSIDTVLGYYVGATLTLGYARGLQSGGQDQYYVFIGGSF
ncbi:MAG: PD40 domain-containing protein [Deltaproteobacteria bacterium]|nr:PD40 domain-containing protein [Deltaproteobacteria bacterium]